MHANKRWASVVEMEIVCFLWKYICLSQETALLLLLSFNRVFALAHIDFLNDSSSFIYSSASPYCAGQMRITPVGFDLIPKKILEHMSIRNLSKSRFFVS